MFALAALSLLAYSQPIDSRSFGNWQVSCSHRLRCVAMEVPRGGSNGILAHASMRITRNGESGRTTVEIWPDRSVAAPVTITAGRSVVYQGRVRGDVIRLIGDDAERAAQAAVQPDNESFVIRAHDGSNAGTVGLGGLDDAMRYIDRFQRKSGLG